MIAGKNYTPHGVSAFTDCLDLINTFGLPVLFGLEPTMSSTNYGSTIYDIIFVGGMIFSNLYSISVAVVLTTLIGLGGTTACVTAGRLAEADPSLKILVRFQKRKLGRSVLF